jgi:hypothetical protein
MGSLSFAVIASVNLGKDMASFAAAMFFFCYLAVVVSGTASERVYERGPSWSGSDWKLFAARGPTAVVRAERTREDQLRLERTN